jgi:V-type H+-transporting ATPase subunit a
MFNKILRSFGWGIFRAWTIADNRKIQLEPEKGFLGSPYAFGMDPVWQLSKNRIAYLNSFKMKFSIIFGFCHMLFGIFLRLCNCM